MGRVYAEGPGESKTPARPDGRPAKAAPRDRKRAGPLLFLLQDGHPRPGRLHHLISFGNLVQGAGFHFLAEEIDHLFAAALELDFLVVKEIGRASGILELKSHG